MASEWLLRMFSLPRTSCLFLRIDYSLISARTGSEPVPSMTSTAIKISIGAVNVFISRLVSDAKQRIVLGNECNRKDPPAGWARVDCAWVCRVKR